jgi:N-acetylneuraminic acid mutarotase
MMKKIPLIVLIVCVSEISFADYWTQKADLPSGERSDAIGFSIGNYGFAGTGYGTASVVYDDLWQYDPSNNNWNTKASVPNQPRYGAIATSCLGKGYFGLGNYLGFKNDWWAYDPILDSWTQKNNFPGTPREYASSFCIDSNIYLGCGLDSIGPTRDWWQYNVTLNSWTPIDSLPIQGSGYFSCVALNFNAKGYVMAGYGSGNRVYEYDPVLQQWNQKNNFPGTIRYAASGFSIGDFGYLGTGETFITSYVKDFWQYDPVADQWYQKNDFIGVARGSSSAFSIGDKGYIGFGISSGGRLKDFWEYTPDSITAISRIPNQLSQILISPNPTTSLLKIETTQNIEQIELFNLRGEKISAAFDCKLGIVDCRLLPPGIYILQASSGEKVWREKFIKE